MISRRIRDARRAAGLSQRALAERLGLSAMAVSKYERGALLPSSSRLMSIAEALGVPLEYMLRPQRFEPDLRWSVRGTVGARAMERLRIAVDDSLERFLTALAVFPEPPLQPVRPFTNVSDDPDEAAARVRRRWGVGHLPVGDLTFALEAARIYVVEVALALPRFEGAVGHASSWPFVVVDPGWTPPLRRFRMAMLLGMLVNPEPGADWQRRFALSLLCPPTLVVHHLGEARRVERREIVLLSSEAGLPASEVAGWLVALGYDGSAKSFGRLAALGDANRERATLLERLVSRALAEEWISEARAAELLGENLSAADVRRWREGEPAGAVAREAGGR